MAHRIEILAHPQDGRALQIQAMLARGGRKASVQVLDVYTIDGVDNPAVLESLAQALHNPVTQKAHIIPPQPALKNVFTYALEIGFLPGVTDNVGHTVQELLSLLSAPQAQAYSSRLYLISGDVKESDITTLSHQLANPLINRIHVKSAAQFQNDGGMDMVVPKVVLNNRGAVADEVDLGGSDAELKKLGQDGIPNADGTRRGPLGLSLLYVQAIRDYFKKKGRAPRDIEIEMLAQSWSEHCKHTIFASPIDAIKDGIYRHYIKRATNEIRARRGDKDFCVSVFSDNAGGIIFDENWLITDKVETHNSPSALDPFGGAITGIVGVNRDCLGFGQGAKPVMNRYGFCLADPRKQVDYYRDAARTQPILQPRTIMDGVIAGVNHGGNCSGIPTPQGFVYFDERYVGKPLVFAGTIGLIPRIINGKPGHEKSARAGDLIVMVGGRVGRDGIHGATFSSVALDEGSPATAVQIGDPITQKKFSDAIVKELRDKGWYSAITDNGAGGLSSSVGEMAQGSGGFVVDLDKVPLKYPGMSPWEIWISESQERMTLAVPPEHADKLIAHLAKRGSEATVIGTFTDSGHAVVQWQGETILDLDLDFIHDGVPKTPLTTTYAPQLENEPDLKTPSDYAPLLNTLLARPNIASKEFIAVQYDHEVQGGAVLKPLQGPGRVYANATITKPVLTSPRGVVLSQGLCPRMSDIDTYAMAANALDMAVRNAVAAGVDYDHLALLDNFCWCSSDEPERLGQLKRAAQAIYDLAVFYGTPFISGKDSMFNDFKGYDATGKPIKISAPPTVLISSIGVIPHVDQAISLAPKEVGDIVYLIGVTKDELGAGEYYDMHNVTGRNAPVVDAALNHKIYRQYSRAARDYLIASALGVDYGGLGAALAKKAIAGQRGLDIDLSGLDLPADKAMFSESAGRILVTVAPAHRKAFEKMFKGLPTLMLGHVAYSNKLNIKNILQADIQKLDEAYKGTFKDY
ncbi:MAG: AIR synthase-related protein [Alphaproteobacteria bacterium]|nr:AIR synthase-related protein [Alphaproteobacteria bacterium]